MNKIFYCSVAINHVVKINWSQRTIIKGLGQVQGFDQVFLFHINDNIICLLVFFLISVNIVFDLSFYFVLLFFVSMNFFTCVFFQMCVC
jgi:hypothetical protein